jgi:transcription-repair coupling factor (superfamily II helicase)
VSLPRPSTKRVAGEPLAGRKILAWCADLLRDVLGEPPVPGAERAAGPAPGSRGAA